ncbi:MAG: hypothetical protein Tsb002_31520 [Wenzhouxiangellaceae bacterium]
MGNTCLVNDASFTIQVTPATDNAGGSGIDTDGYQVCRSNDVTGWGGCSHSITLNSTTSFVVTGSHRPAPGQRRAYYFRSRDNAGNWGPWNDEMYIQTINDTTPPGSAGPTTSPNCVSTVGNTCLVNDANFTIQVTPATDNAGGSGIDTDGYQVCRSNDVTGWGGCSHTMSLNSTTSFVVTGSHRPAPGLRRAYYFRSRDNAGNWGPWNDEMYIETIADTTAPGKPGPTTSPDCVSVANGTCFVNDANFTIRVTPATDNAGGSGINPNGYQVCRSNHTDGWGGCAVSMSTTSGTSFLVSGAHRPAPGERRAYYFRARDNAGNWGPWNDEMYIETLEPTTARLCLDSFYASVQQGNSSRLPAALSPDPFRPANDLNHYHNFVTREGHGAVKVWDALHGVNHSQFNALMSDPQIDVIVYRPMYSFNTTTDDEQVDYGQLAQQLYSLYAGVSKVVILTGWEQDHQLNSFLANKPNYTVADYRDFVQQRQNGVSAARAAASVPGCPTCTVRLHVFHAVEVVQSHGTVLNQVIAQMNPKPDFVSYSAWGGLSDPDVRLTNIQNVSGLPRDRIFIGEFGYRLDLNPANAAALVNNFLSKVRGWGSHMAFLWQFNQGVQLENYVVYGEPELGTPAGYVRENTHPLGSVAVKRDVINVVRNANVSLPCSEWAW